MKKMNAKGFTLIELLAVITIMGILMIVAIPAVTRTIENSRKDTFVNTVQNYVGGAKTMWASDNLQCGDYVSSAVQSGYYYIEINSASESVPQLLESGGKSSWGSRDIMGNILVKVYDVKSPGKDAADPDDDVITRKVEYYPTMVDDIHGVNITASGPVAQADRVINEKLKRGNLLMSGAKYTLVADAPASGNALKDYTVKAPVTAEYDFDGDGTAEAVTAVKCVEV